MPAPSDILSCMEASAPAPRFFTGPDFLGVVLYGLVAGVLFGAIFGAIGQAAQGGRRDFASVRSMQAEHYELQVDHEVSAQAKQLLAELPSA